MAELQSFKYKEKEFKLLSNWISQKDDKSKNLGITEDVVNYAEAFANNLLFKGFDNKTGKEFVNKDKSLSTSQLRNFFGEIRRIQLNGFEKNKNSFFMLKPKLAYAVARAKNREKIEIFQKIINPLMSEVKSEIEYNNFVQFVEATVAFHKAFGGE